MSQIINPTETLNNLQKIIAGEVSDDAARLLLVDALSLKNHIDAAQAEIHRAIVAAERTIVYGPGNIPQQGGTYR